jgi:hypothetical protein
VHMACIKELFIVPNSTQDSQTLPSDGMDHIPFCELSDTRQRLSHVDQISCWLMCQTYDAFDVLRILKRRRFSGTVICYFHALAHPNLVASELAEICPKITLNLVQTDTADKDLLRYLSSVMGLLPR